MTTLSVIPSYEPSWLAVLGTRRKNKIHSFILAAVAALAGEMADVCDTCIEDLYLVTNPVP